MSSQLTALGVPGGTGANTFEEAYREAGSEILQIFTVLTERYSKMYYPNQISYS